MTKDDWRVLAAIAAAVAILVFFVVWPVPAQANHAATTRCFSATKIIEMLRTEFGESLSTWGIGMHGKQLVQLYTSPETGTWTLVVTLAGQRPCIIAAGAKLNEEPQQLAGESES